MAIFSASMVTTIVSIVHTAFELSTNRNAEAIAAHVEVSPSQLRRAHPIQLSPPSTQSAVSLIICNLAVLVTWLARVLRHGEDLESGGWSDSSAGGTPRNRSRITSLRFGGNPAGSALGGTTNYELDDDGVHGAQLSTFKRKDDFDSFAPAGAPQVASVTFEPDTKKQDVEGGSSEAH